MAFSTFKLYDKFFIGTRKVVRRYAFTLSAVAGQGYVSGTGENIDFTLATNPSKLARPLPPGGKAGPIPGNDDILIVRVPAGYDAVVSQAAASPTLKNYNMRIFSTANTELGTADYPAELKGKDIVIDVYSAARYN